MVMDAVGSAASAIGEALGIIKPDKAKLVVVGSNKPDKGPFEIECMFNPTEYTLSQSARINVNTTPATPGGTPQYGGASPASLKMELFFDDYAAVKGDVTPKITTLLSWTKPTKKSLDAGRACAPLVQFKWGGNPQLSTFKGFLTSVDVTYSIFRKDGTPVQAKVRISIDGQEEQPAGTNPTSHSTKSRRTRTTVEGDTLQSVAFDELGKPVYWRAIAELNGIDDPLRVGPGTVLLIPSVADAARNS
jgi:Contractile injection system tube protein/LysM domain